MAGYWAEFAGAISFILPAGLVRRRGRLRAAEFCHHQDFLLNWEPLPAAEKRIQLMLRRDGPAAVSHPVPIE